MPRKRPKPKKALPIVARRRLIRGPVQAFADTLSKQSSGKRRMDRAQAGDMLEDVRSLLHKHSQVDIYDFIPGAKVDERQLYKNGKTTFMIIPLKERLIRKDMPHRKKV